MLTDAAADTDMPAAAEWLPAPTKLIYSRTSASDSAFRGPKGATDAGQDDPGIGSSDRAEFAEWFRSHGDSTRDSGLQAGVWDVRGDWQTFFLAQVGASAALTGLVFVAMSINLREIIGRQDLVGRAGEAVILLVQPVVVGLAALTPYSRTTQGMLILVVAGIAWAAVVRLLINSARSGQRSTVERVYSVTSTQLAALPAVVGAIVLIAGGDGYGFLALGAVMSLTVGVSAGWVLLVEIVR